jgi:hypothetical protein
MMKIDESEQRRTEQVVIYVEPELVPVIKRVARREGLSVSAFVRNLAMKRLQEEPA